MITIEVVITEVSGLRRQDLENWIANQWVRPDRRAGEFLFHEIDVARVRLIHELREDMEVNDEAVPIVLSLLDQVYDLRRRMRQLSDAMEQHLPEDKRRSLIEYLTRHSTSA